ncbi:MAG: hypothetical protein JWM27_1056 [Gemmatimonadetes bacterium]|nr:hypothetical protein [Gemmatimonadota bacterium]
MPSSRFRTPTVFALAAASCIACAPRHADRPPWVTFVSNARIAVLADTSRIVRAGNVRDVWLRFEYSEPQPAPSGGDSFTRMELLEGVNCAARQAHEREMRIYDAAGNPVGPPRISTQLGLPGWRRFEAHPMGVALFDPLCDRLAHMPGG